MFFDHAKICIKGGDGGNGVVAFRREKYVPYGGPSGGDGGKGGDVILVTDPGLRTLADFRYKRHYKAERGQHGQGKNMHGSGGEDLVIRVPPGTILRDAETGEMIADLVGFEERFVVAKGGRGGRGNARFSSAQNRVPELAENGEPGQERWLELELRLLADVGLIGLPNAGKSTLISIISAAKPKIADYPFTTLVPNLGVVQGQNGESFVVADIPGLIEGAHQGAGLGHDFLQHIERTKLLIHVLDAAPTDGRDIVQDFSIINKELELYNPKLLDRPQLVAVNKMDLTQAKENLQRLIDHLAEQHEVFPISAATGQGVEILMQRVAEVLALLPDEEPGPVTEPVIHRMIEGKERFTIGREGPVFIVAGKEVERHLAMTNFDNEAAVKRFAKILKMIGVDRALKDLGAKSGDMVRIKKMEFEYLEEE
ncbi:MAG: GTPase ObgE [Syntrophomonadaceae bacterium]|nr:GTPase ObgE [Syntrophomonadaceae bacterium]